MNIKERILIISGIPFRPDTNLGKTLDALFSSFRQEEIAQLYFSPQLPLSTKCDNYFQINEKQLIRSVFGIFTGECGKQVKSSKDNLLEGLCRNPTRLTRKKTTTMIKIGRDLLWTVSFWKNKKLKNWLKNFNPNMVFMVFPDTKKSAKIAYWIAKKYSCPIVLYVTDDYYTDSATKKSLIRRLYYKNYHKSIHKMMRAVIKIIGCSDLASKEYGERFHIDYATIYTPAPNESLLLQLNPQTSKPLIFRYFGNLGLNRWKTLQRLALVLEEINKEQIKAVLEVYSAFEPSEEIRQALNINNSVSFRGAVFGEDYYKLLQNTDVAVHVESFDKNMMERTRLSISTKIADYLGAGKCILAIGNKELASMQHLENKAIVVNDLSCLKEKLEFLIDNPNERIRLQKQARKYAETLHDRDKISHNLKKLLAINKD